MARRGYTKVTNYLDDLIVIGDTFESCQWVQKELIHLLISLSFHISLKKCSSPSTNTRYLDIDINSLDMTLSLPSDKLAKLHQGLDFFRGRRRATKRQLQ